MRSKGSFNLNVINAACSDGCNYYMVFHGTNDQLFFSYFLKTLVEHVEDKYQCSRKDILVIAD